MPSEKPRRSTAQRDYVLDSSARHRRLQRHLEELEADNYNAEVTVELEERMLQRSGGNVRQARKRLEFLRGFSKKRLNHLLEEAAADFEASPAVPNYYSILSSPSVYPTRSYCSVCGQESRYKCVRCGMHYCRLSCRDTHKETRCLKFVV